MRKEHVYYFARPWNFEARFVVAGTNEFSMSQQKEIFHFLSKVRIYNCIIVNQEHYVMDIIYSSRIKVNAVGTGMKLGVYTWFPYQSSDSCTEVNDITLLASWVISAQGHFNINPVIFPLKISNNFNECQMKAVVRNGHSFFTTNYRNKKCFIYNPDGDLEGLEYDLLKIVLKHLNMTFFNLHQQILKLRKNLHVI
jgi:hypothetical protein